MSKLSKKERKRIIDILQKGEDVPIDYKHILFPPEKKEYELVYANKEREEDILANTMAVPLQPIKTFGKNGKGWTNQLIFGDNLQAMKALLDNPEIKGKVKLIYIDPPFATKQDFKGSQDQKAYQDKIAGAKFIEFLRKRLIFLRELLANNGSIFVHLDWKKVHYAKVIMDEILKESLFQNEVIWYYEDKFATGGAKLDHNHDIILQYSRNSEFIANRVMISKEKATKRALRRKVNGKTIDIIDENGSKIWVTYNEKKIDDVWKVGRTISKNEITGYPTQKPEKLLELAIKYSSNENEIILDAFAGSGTTLAVAEKLGRRWIGIDCGKLAIYTIQKRMLNLKAEIETKENPLS